jgi:hypothetical protein
MLNKGRVLLAASVLALCMGAAAPTQAFADEHDREAKCERRIHDAENKLQDAVRKHGEHSRQAEKRRHDVEEARARCEHHEDRYR